MKKIILSVALVLSFIAASAQFPSIDSMRRFNNRYIRTSPIEAFTNYRLNTLIHGILSWMDDSLSTGGGGGGSANLTFSRNATTLSIFSDGGTDVVLPRATHSLAGLLAAEDMRRWDSSFHLANAPGSGDSLLFKVNDSTAYVKRLIAGTGITLTPTDDNITITSTGGGGVSDGDKGDITISGSGATFTIDNSVVTEAKMSLSDVGTYNATNARHGFLPKLNDSANWFMNGLGNWSPIGTGNLHATLLLGDTTNKFQVFNHRPNQNIIRIINPNNYDSSYVHGGGPTYGAGRFAETILRVDGVNASGRPNYVYMRGYNQNGGGGRENATEASIHEAIEFNWEAGGIRKFEWHQQVTGTNGVTARISSYEINKENAVGVLFHEIDQFLLKRTPLTVGGAAPDYAVFGESGMDLINGDAGEISTIKMYTDVAANLFSIQSGNNLTKLENFSSNWDMEVTTTRNLILSGRIKFNDDAAPTNGTGHITMDMPASNTGKTFWLRNAAEESLLEITDVSGTGNQIKPIGQLLLSAGTSVFAPLRMPTGVAPSSPTEGDMYKDATDLYIYLNGAWLKLNDPYTNEIIGSGSGTSGTIPKYTGNYTIANSLITEASDLITVTGRLAATDQVYIGPLASDPATNLANGAMYYNTTSGKMRVREAGAWVNVISSAGTAVVTSVALAMPSGFSVTGSPITTSGTLNVTTSLNGVIVGNGSGFTTLADGGMAVAKLAPGSNGQYLTVVGGVATWGSLSGGGDVVGPASAVDNQMVLFNSTTGKLIKASTGSGFAKYSSGVPTFQSEIISGDITSLVYTKVNNFPTARLAGRTTASTGAIEALTVDGTLTLASGNLGVNQAGLTLSNLAGAVTTTQGGIPTGGTANQILSKINSTDYNTQWVTPGVYVTDGVKDDITVSSSGTLWSITSASVTTSMLATQANNTVIANLSGGLASPSAVTTTALTAALDIATPSLKGLVPSGGTSLQVLRVNSGGTALEWASGGGGGESSTASNGLTLTGVDIKLGGSLTANTAINGAWALEFGTTTPLSSFEVSATGDLTLESGGGNVFINAGVRVFLQTGTDANNTIGNTNGGITLPTITANRTLTLPSTAAGKTLWIHNNNTSAFTWTFSGSTVHDAYGNTVLQVPRGAMQIQYSSATSSWKMVSMAGGNYEVEYISSIQSDYTLSAASGVQSAFPAAQDAVLLEASTTYEMEGLYIMNTGATTHTTAMAFALGGGAVVTSWEYTTQTWTGAANSISTTVSRLHVTGVASKVLNSTSTSVWTIVEFKGIVRMNTGGTVTPQINFSANPTGTNLMKVGSYIKFTKKGSNTMTSFGPWN